MVGTRDHVVDFVMEVAMDDVTVQFHSLQRKIDAEREKWCNVSGASVEPDGMCINNISIVLVSAVYVLKCSLGQISAV